MKIRKLLLLTPFLLTLAVSAETYAMSAAPAVMLAASDESAVEPRADIIEWRYKTVDGKLYRRQYNYSKQVWIGEWELC